MDMKNNEDMEGNGLPQHCFRLVNQLMVTTEHKRQVLELELNRVAQDIKQWNV